MDFKKAEEKWQKIWEDNKELYKAIDLDKKNKKYVLVEFPYPSGSGLHVGHTFSFTGGDVYARFMRMKGNNVLFPMGWDAFGLPTENYAIKMKRKPQDVTKDNTEMFKRQMKRLAFSFDWSRELNTTDPKYYKWTQWIFIKLFEKGLAYKQEIAINWCPSCKVGLANEEVVNGKCERCGVETERRNINQWIVKITNYADRLIDGLKDTDFIEKVAAAQINWIGKSEGVKIKFKIKDKEDELEVFTTRPDTLFGATFMVIAPEHKLVSEILKLGVGVEEIEQYIKQARSKSDMERTELSKEKTGVFSDLYAINPVNNKKIPIWISDFVLGNYGTGAIMSVPAHDQRDEDFAKKYNLPIIRVFDDGNRAINSEWINSLTIEEAKKKMIGWLREKGIGEESNSYHLRDWIFSRQHYWGEPIPMIFCKQCAENQKNKKSPLLKGDLEGLNAGWMPVAEDQLPVVLPEVNAYEPSDDGQSPLSKMTDWVNVKCPKCGGEAKRETDTMPNWAGSDWYFLRYLDVDNDIEIASGEKQKYWMPVDVYIGGDEHNTLHLLYSRFIYQFLGDIGAIDKTIKEPYFRRISHGVILGSDNQRMSKSKGNVIIPETVADKYGVDVLRTYLMFMGPFDATMVWNDNTLMGVKRFLDKFEKFIGAKRLDVVVESDKKVKLAINKLIKSLNEDIGSFKFNTSIAKMMETLNKLESLENNKLELTEIKIMIKLLAPFAPYLAEELWASYAKATECSLEKSVHISKWPEVDERYFIEDMVKIAVAVNGKTREVMEVNIDIVEKETEVLKMARNLVKVKEYIGNKKIQREVFAKGRMVNFVVK